MTHNDNSVLEERDILEIIPILSEQERSECLQKTEDQIVNSIGQKPNPPHRLGRDKPDWESYKNRSISKYPTWMIRLLLGFFCTALFAAFSISLFRLFTAGRDSFVESMGRGSAAADIAWQGVVVGISVFILAESVVIACGLIKAIYFEKGSGRFLYAPMIGGSVLAYVGNWTVANPHTLFGYLEALLPTTFVFFLTLALEQIAFKTLEARHENKTHFAAAVAMWEEEQKKLRAAYNEIVEKWEWSINNPRENERFIQTYANYLRSKISDNILGMRGRTSREEKISFLNNISIDEWRALVSREMNVDKWFAQLSSENPVSVMEIAANPTTPVVGFGSQHPNYGFQTSGNPNKEPQ